VRTLEVNSAGLVISSELLFVLSINRSNKVTRRLLVRIISRSRTATVAPYLSCFWKAVEVPLINVHGREVGRESIPERDVIPICVFGVAIRVVIPVSSLEVCY
jgi:hypothetical protein